MAGKDGLVPACSACPYGAVLGHSHNDFRAHIYFLGKHKAFSSGSSKMSKFRKFWHFHLANLALLIFFSCAGILIARGMEARVKSAKEQGAIEILINLPLRSLREISV